MTLRDLNPKWKRKGEEDAIVTEVEFDMSERFWPGLTHVVVHHWLYGNIFHLNLYVPDNAVWVVMENAA